MAAMYRDEETMGTSLDFINLMTYDFHGGWDQTPFGHNAPLHPPKNNPKNNVGMSIEESVEKMIELVGDKYTKKLVMGLPTYGRSVNVPAGTDVEQALAEAKTLSSMSASKKVMTWETGSVSYWHQEYLAGKKEWEVKHDPDADQTYLWNKTENIFMSYDTPADLKKKVQFLNSKNLGGAMFWEMDDDPMIYPKKMGDHAKDEKRQGEKLFDAVLDELESCQVPHRSRLLDAIIV
jgi:chitinase